MNLVMKLMEQIEGIRDDLRSQSDTLNKKLDAQTEGINRKLDKQAEDNKNEFKELREDVAEMKARMAEGSEKMRNLRRDVDDTKHKCAATTALEKKRPCDEETKAVKKKEGKFPWWVLLLAGGALSWIGERGVSRFFNAMADPPAATQTKP